MSRDGKEETIENFLDEARKRWGEEHARALGPSLRRTAESVWKVERFKAEIGEEPDFSLERGG